MVSLVLIGEPKSLHIPAIAMQLKSNRESSWSYPGEKCQSLDALMGGNASRWVTQRQETHDIRRIVTRNYIPRQTAFYADWLVFFQPDIESEFLATFPKYDADHAIERLQSVLADLTEKVEEKLARSAYDLSRYPTEQRRSAADRFIEFDDKLRATRERIEELIRAKSVRDHWRLALEQELLGK